MKLLISLGIVLSIIMQSCVQEKSIDRNQELSSPTLVDFIEGRKYYNYTIYDRVLVNKDILESQPDSLIVVFISELSEQSQKFHKALVTNDDSIKMDDLIHVDKYIAFLRQYIETNKIDKPKALERIEIIKARTSANETISLIANIVLLESEVLEDNIRQLGGHKGFNQ
ncbi:MAG: hypothetical protein ABJF04_09255 [Reichenbachiella sp.]|uniref:hypothetical protein n=1 Tax=Reichenbachiella sp. TaxID=2184521 RepID=UPI0032665B6D